MYTSIYPLPRILECEIYSRGGALHAPLPLGLCTVPRVFTKCLAAVIAFFRVKGICIYPYMDDCHSDRFFGGASQDCGIYPEFIYGPGSHNSSKERSPTTLPQKALSSERGGWHLDTNLHRAFPFQRTRYLTFRIFFCRRQYRSEYFSCLAVWAAEF